MAAVKDAVMHIKDIKQWKTEKARRTNRPLIVDFSAKWCGPCKMIAPTFEDLARKHQAVARFASIDIDEVPEAAVSIQTLPTFQVLAPNGDVSDEMTGAKVDKLISFVEGHLPAVPAKK